MSKMGRPSYRRVLAGVDTIEANAKGPLLDGVPEFLEAMQQEAIAEREQRHHRKQRSDVKLETPWQIAGQPLMIAPYGVRQGMYQWTLSSPALNIDIGQGNVNDITAEMRLSSSFLWQYGYRQAWEQVTDLMQQIGDFTFQVSELHACVDIAGVDVARLRPQDFVGRGHVTRWHAEDALIVDMVERQKKGEERPMIDVVTRYLEQETIRFSPRAAMSGTIYNKIREIRFQSPDKLWFLDLWKQNGWDGESPVARLELRPERAVFREMGIETVEQAFDRLDAFWAYGTQNWIRHTIPTLDKNRSRWPTSVWWQKIQQTTFEKQDADPAQRHKVRAFREKQMLGALLGYLESWEAWQAESDEEVQDMSMVLRDLVDRAVDHYLSKESDYITETIQKRRKFGFAS